MLNILICLILIVTQQASNPITIDTSRILFVGNSIALHPPLSIHEGTWGMAASAADKDYVHRVQLMLAARTGKIPEIAIERFDVGWDSAAVFAAVDRLDPTVIIVQVGDNAGELARDEYVATLTDFLRAVQADERTVLLTGVWYSAEREGWSAEAGAEVGVPFVPIQGVQSAVTVAQADCWATDPVCSHPGDAGMQEIASRIMAALMQNEIRFLPWLTTGQ
jgi:hypothetical protein